MNATVCSCRHISSVSSSPRLHLRREEEQLNVPSAGSTVMSLHPCGQMGSPLPLTPAAGWQTSVSAVSHCHHNHHHHHHPRLHSTWMGSFIRVRWVGGRGGGGGCCHGNLREYGQKSFPLLFPASRFPESHSLTCSSPLLSPCVL